MDRSKPELHRIKVCCPDGLGVLARIFVDDQELKGVTLVDFRIDSQGWSQLTLLLFADVEIEGEAEIVRKWKRQWQPEVFTTSEQVNYRLAGH